ncbi:MAG TPA: ATP-binding protein [Euzebyales bacterium]|nr:ATP-binding protein [Euzebyales bacterium]
MSAGTSDTYELARSHARIRAAIDAVITIDTDGLVVEWNPAAERIFGWPAAEAIGRDMAELIVPPHLRAAHRAGLARYLSTGHGAVLDTRLDLPACHRDGTELTVELTITAFEAGGRTWFTGWARDLSELRRERAARRALEQAGERLDHRYRALRELDGLKTELIATVSHELRTPLTAIMGFAELLEDAGHEVSEVYRGFATTIWENAERLTRLIDDLLALNHLDSNALRFAPASQDPAPIVREVVDGFRARARARHVDLAVTADDGPACEIDGPRLRQVASNLVANAIKFTPVEGGRVEVAITWGGDVWDLRVSDEGIGIPPGDVDKLGTRFYRASNAAQRVSSGTGLGLAVCRAIVEGHGGHLDIRSVEGEGTTVTATFPCRPPEAERGR